MRAGQAGVYPVRTRGGPAGRLLAVVERPFNNPFAESLASLRKRLLEQAHEPKAPPTPAAGPAIGDDKAFEAATEGAVPLAEGSSREVPPSHPDRGGAKRRRRRSGGEFSLETDFDVRYSDLFIRGRSKDVSARTAKSLEEGRFAVHSHVDLHGMVLEDAMARVDEFIADTQRRGERCVLVVTGKGNNSPGQKGVLRHSIPEWLARGPSARRVLAFSSARNCDGGSGALYVLLRKAPSSKSRISVETGPGP